MVSINLEAKKVVDTMIEKSNTLNISVDKLSNGSTIIDCGINAEGGIKAGELYTKVCLGGISEVGISIPGDLSETFALPSVKIKTHTPAISTIGAQKASWSVKVDDFVALGSGPARALARKPSSVYDKLGYEDHADIAILSLETNDLPGEDVTEYIASECDVLSENVYVLVAPTSSITGSIQISGRAVENGTHKMMELLDFDINKIRFASGIAPISPVDPDSLGAMAKTNDAILFGARTYFYLYSDESDDIASLAKALPASASKNYGRPFYKIFKEADYDFYNMDNSLFAPAEVVINDMRTGELFREGKVDTNLLMKSFNVN